MYKSLFVFKHLFLFKLSKLFIVCVVCVWCLLVDSHLFLEILLKINIVILKSRFRDRIYGNSLWELLRYVNWPIQLLFWRTTRAYLKFVFRNTQDIGCSGLDWAIEQRRSRRFSVERLYWPAYYLIVHVLILHLGIKNTGRSHCVLVWAIKHNPDGYFQ